MHPSEIPPPYIERGVWGILSPFGQVWTPLVFDTPERAREHLQTYWRNTPRHELTDFKIVKVCRTVEVEQIVSVEITYAPEIRPND